MTIQAGTRLGPYEVLAPVGAGGMGEVWRAKDTRLEREVAVKVLPERLAENEQFASSEEPRELASGLEPGTRPSTYLADDFLLIGGGSGTTRVMIMDPTAAPPTFDLLNLSARFVSISPDRRWIAYVNLQSGEYAGILLQPWPALDRRYLVAPIGNEPRWASPTELVYYVTVPEKAGASSGTLFYRLTIDPTSDPPVKKRELIIREPRFADTPGWSHAVWPGGDLVYLQSPADNLGHYLRVVPGWVDQMKRAVDEANR